MALVTDDLESAVFRAVYHSSEQRRLRIMAIALLSLKHGLRGMLFSWPLYFIALMPFLIPAEAGWWIILFVFPALLVSGYILLMGVREEYHNLVDGKILPSTGLSRLLWSSPGEL
jgi:hypothetical protein